MFALMSVEMSYGLMLRRLDIRRQPVPRSGANK